MGTALLRIRARAHAEDVNCPTAADVVTRKIHFTLDTERELR